MHRVNTAAGFIKANMPLGKPDSLTLQQAWDVAAFINHHERPRDPRDTGDLAATDKRFHQHQCYYGEQQGKHPLGAGTGN
jgi:thiosulfate dehydrogenase